MAFQSNLQSYVAAAAIVRGDRLKFSAGAITVEPAGATDASVGTAKSDAAIGDVLQCVMHTPGHVVEVRAAGAFAVGATLYGAAAGEVDDAVNAGTDRFHALQASTAADEVVSAFIPFVGA